MNEPEARKLALEISKKSGVTKHWHQPYIRFGAGTALSFMNLLIEQCIECKSTILY